MTRGPKKHLKRLDAPKGWLLDKMGGIWAPRPSTGPHKLRESLPLVLILRNRLKYALTNKEAKMICMQRLVSVDSKIRTDPTFPAGFMDVVSIPASRDTFRVLYDVKGRFKLLRISDDEAKVKLCRVMNVAKTGKNIPYLVTHDGRTIRYPDPLIKKLDTIKLDIATGKVLDFYKFEIGNVATITRGRNTGRIGVITHRDRHPGSFDIVHLRDAAGNDFATRLNNVFVVGKGGDPAVAMVPGPKGAGIKLDILQERALWRQKRASGKK